MGAVSKMSLSRRSVWTLETHANMQFTRFVTITVMATAMAVSALAQFDGPAPVAWRFLQPTSVAPGGAPLVNGNTVYQSVGGRVFAIDKESGNLLWRFPQVEPIPGFFKQTPVLIDGTLFAAGDNKVVYAFNAATGALKWSQPTSATVRGPVISVGDSIVFATTDNKLNALKAADGKLYWDVPYNVFDTISGSIAADGANVLFFNGRQELVSLDSTTRKTNWRQKFTQLPTNPLPVVANDTIYTVSGPYLIALNPVTGTARWQVSTGLQLNMPPAASADAVFVVSQDGKVLAYKPNKDVITKTPITLGFQAIQNPTATGGLLVVPSSQGGVALVDPVKGEIVWNYLIRPIPNSSGSRSNSTPGSNFPGNGGRTQNTDDDVPVTVQASGPAAVAGKTLIVPTRDGSVIAFDAEVGIDLTAPTVEMVFPHAGEQVSGLPPLVLAFRLKDEASGINNKSITVEVDGQKQEHTFNKEGILLVRFNLNGPNKPLSDGRKVITVTATDWVGNVRKQNFALTIDNTLRPVTLPGSETENGPGGPGGPGGRGGGGKGGGGGNGGD